MPPPQIKKLYVENLTLKIMVLDHEVRALMNGVSVLIKKDLREFPHPFLHMRTQRIQPSMSQGEGFHQTLSLPAP